MGKLHLHLPSTLQTIQSRLKWTLGFRKTRMETIFYYVFIVTFENIFFLPLSYRLRYNSFSVLPGCLVATLSNSTLTWHTSYTDFLRKEGGILARLSSERERSGTIVGFLKAHIQVSKRSKDSLDSALPLTELLP